MAMNPEQSFQHTLREISVNRADPCELARELLSNSYDASASKIHIFPLAQKRGLLFFDNGVGLSIKAEDKKNGILPYTAFFSIGKGTKNSGEQIGYKCQGSKLCFASRRFSLITRCDGEPRWRWKTIDNPKQTLDTSYDLTPQETDEPWTVLRDQFLADADERTQPILKTLNEDFFKTEFKRGLMIVIEDFEADKYDSYFSVNKPSDNYLYNYIRFYTAHGDVRRIGPKEHGFRPSDAKAVRSVLRPDSSCEVKLWCAGDSRKGTNSLVEIPLGWPYLSPPQDKLESPAAVHTLRNGRFYARHATTFKYEDRYYSLMLAIDGNRRAHEQYEMLGRRGNRRCGISLSAVRGILLASNGIVVCQHMQLLDDPLLEEWSVLQEGAEHMAFIIDGPFELVTNRDALAPSSLRVLGDPKFIEQIRSFLVGIKNSKEGIVLNELIERLKRETTRHRENQYIENNTKIRSELSQRESFVIKNAPPIEGQRFFAPQAGEEHFVGTLYTLFAHVIPMGHPLKHYWARPLTFAGLGIDALCVLSDQKPFANGNLLSIEYKHFFASGEEFNHPLNITDRIICWDLDTPKPGSTVSDSYKYDGTVMNSIEYEGKNLGFSISDVRHRHELMEISHEVLVIGLRSLLEATFQVQFRPGVKPSKTTSKASKH